MDWESILPSMVTCKLLFFVMFCTKLILIIYAEKLTPIIEKVWLTLFIETEMFEVVSCCDKGSENTIIAKSLAFTDRVAVK